VRTIRVRDDYYLLTLGFSGSAYGNTALGTETILMDWTVFGKQNSPEGSYQQQVFDVNAPNSGILDIEFTVSGAKSGNGTFSKSDFHAFIMQGLADASVRGPLIGNDSSFLTSNAYGGLVLQGGSNGAPTLNTQINKTYATSSGTGDVMGIISFNVANAVAPASAVPEPSSYAMLLGGLGLMGFIAHRRNKNV
jgi:hypothetical protein